MKAQFPSLAQVRLFALRACKSQLGQNILANYLTVVWMGGLSIALIPVYLKRLGPDQWGIVAICMTIQGFLGLLDAGLSQIMPRDIARVAGDRAAEARVFRVFSRSYLGLGIAGLVLGQACVPWLIEHWFNQGQGVGDGANLALRLVLVQFMFQFANNAHSGYWNGLQAQKLANFRQCAFGTAKHAGALMLVYTWHEDALAYLLPFALVAAVEWWANRGLVLGGLVNLGECEIRFADFKKLAGEAGVLALGVLIGMLISQIDRIVLSRSVDPVSFGRYVIVANLGLAFMQLQYPLMRAFFPRIARADTGGGGASPLQLGIGVFVLCILPCGLVAMVAPWLLAAWVGDPQIVAEGAAPLRLILGAVAINAGYNIIYQRILVRGHGRLVVLVNVVALTVVTPVVFFAAQKYGIVAGGVAWMLGAVVQLVFGLLWIFKNRAQRSQEGFVNE